MLNVLIPTDSLLWVLELEGRLYARGFLTFTFVLSAALLLTEVNVLTFLIMVIVQAAATCCGLHCGLYRQETVGSVKYSLPVFEAILWPDRFQHEKKRTEGLNPCNLVASCSVSVLFHCDLGEIMHLWGLQSLCHEMWSNCGAGDPKG